MKVSIIAVDGAVVVDGVAHHVRLDGMDRGIHSVQWDTTTRTGLVTFRDTEFTEVQERDLEAERREEEPLRQDLERAEEMFASARKSKDQLAMSRHRRSVDELRERLNSLGAKTRTIRIYRQPERISNFKPFDRFLDRWHEEDMRKRREKEESERRQAMLREKQKERKPG